MSLTPENERRVWVTLRTSGIDPDGYAEEEQTLRFPGRLTENGGAYLLHYTERIEDTSDTEVHLRLRPGKVMMMRQGDYSVSLIFEVGKHYEGVYHTPFGDLDITVETLMLSKHISAKQGDVLIRYDESVSGQPAGARTMRISYAPRGAQC